MKTYKGVKGEVISSDEKELKRQWSMVEKQNKKLRPLQCAMYERQKIHDAIFAVAFLSIGVVIISLLFL